MSGAVPLIPRIHSLYSPVQVYLTSFIYPSLIMFRIIHKIHKLRQPANTVYTAAELHLSESGFPVCQLFYTDWHFW